MATINPAAILKIFGALAPLMGNKELGEAMVEEIKSLFVAMHNIEKTHLAIAEALRSIDTRLARLEERSGKSLDENQIQALIEYQNGVNING